MSTILVVDDEPLVLEVVATALQLEKYDVLAAVTAKEAHDKATLREGGIDLLIVNHTLANEAGRNLVEDLLSLQPRMKVLRFSGHLEGQLRARGEIRPDSFFIQKPFLPKQLVGKVRDIIGPAS
jgi:DNA-binding NtrC family response regulator